MLGCANVKQLAKEINLNDAQAAILALPDSDVEDDVVDEHMYIHYTVIPRLLSVLLSKLLSILFGCTISHIHSSMKMDVEGYFPLLKFSCLQFVVGISNQYGTGSSR